MVCGVLDGVASLALEKQKFVFRAPVYKSERWAVLLVSFVSVLDTCCREGRPQEGAGLLVPIANSMNAVEWRSVSRVLC